MSLLEFSERVSERITEHTVGTCQPPSKKVRIDEVPEHERERITSNDRGGIFSVETMLSVPTDIIFRKVQNKPLLTRTEGQCFLRITMLAQELDALVDLTERMLHQRRQSRELRQTLGDYSNPSLRPLAVLTRVIEGQATPALVDVQQAMSKLMMELSSCSALLRQSAEQNWSMNESLLDAMGGTLAAHNSRMLARDKRNTAELEEEIAKRIDALLGMASLDFPDERRRLKQCEETFGTRRNLFGEKNSDCGAFLSEPLREVCSRLFCTALDRGSAPFVPPRPLTQPDDSRSKSSQQSTQDLDFEGRESVICEMDESQSSFRRRTTAAETLANLCSSKPL
jgi:hypothetical protein